MQMTTEYMLKVVALPVLVEPFKISKQAQSLGCIRKEIWQRFDSINGVGIKHRSVRSDWVKTRDFKPLAAKAWKVTNRSISSFTNTALAKKACIN